MIPKFFGFERCLLLNVARLFLLLLLVVLTGCARTPKWQAEPFPMFDAAGEPIAPEKAAELDADEPVFARASGNEVILQPYDSVRVRFLYWPELDDEQVIRPDGRISLLMVGDITAEGKTPAQLHQELLALYEPLLNNPEINVAVTSLASNRVYVFGSVLAPGLIPLEGKLTLLGAIAQAGGFNEREANKSMVVVIRDIDGQQYARTANLKTNINRQLSDTFHLEPYDIVYVPEKTIVKMNQFVSQYINGMVPSNIGSYGLGGRPMSVSAGRGNTAGWLQLPSINVNTGN